MHRSYADLIDEVYIKPIRSCLIIDDDYPTWEEILQTDKTTTDITTGIPKKKWKTDPEPIKELITKLRAPGHSLILDIDDGSSIDLKEGTPLISNLHQTDLLILDYQLEGTSQDGTKSIKIIRDVNSNDHFNLVVLHTSDDLDQAIRDILLGILAPCILADRDEKVSAGHSLIVDAEDDLPDIQEKIRDAVEVEQYIAFRACPRKSLTDVFKGHQPFSALAAVCLEAGWKGKATRTIFEWAMLDFEDRSSKKMHHSEIPNLTWSIEGTKWIRSSCAFIAFSSKKGVTDLIAALQEGLSAWAPRPSRLLVAKLRKELEERGAIAEDSALGNNDVLARWYYELLSVDDDKQGFLLHETLSRHTEQLMAEVSDHVISYAKALINIDKATIDESAAEPVTMFSIIDQHFNLDLSDQKVLDNSELEHNVFICSTKPSGDNLKTGHIFKIGVEYWVCLSPLCDLVPGQKSSGIFGDVGARMPFIGVRFRKVSEREFAKYADVQSNRYVFIREGQDRVILCINEANPKSADSSPHWYPLYASNQGKFTNEFELTVSKVALEGDELTFQSHETTILTQLRYEYALNLMQKLGASLNRIGLDFSGLSAND